MADPHASELLYVVSPGGAAAGTLRRDHDRLEFLQNLANCPYPRTSRFPMSSRHSIAVEIDSRRVRGLWATREGAAVRLGGSFVEMMPPEIDPQDAAATGKWLRAKLRATGFPRAGITLVIPRERVVLKRLSMPTTDADELTDMVRLAMLREIPFDAADAVVDYVPVEASATSTSVMAVAVPAAMLDHLRTVMRAMKYPLQRVTLRTHPAALRPGAA